MKVFIPGIDGYLGWPLAMYLTARGHEVQGADNMMRRALVEQAGSHSAIPIVEWIERRAVFLEKFKTDIVRWHIDLKDFISIFEALRAFNPDAIVHLGEIPSAPYSMIGIDQAAMTQVNNIVGTLNILYAMKEACPEAHLIKLGTMGEYGTPNMDIPEGFFEIEYRGRKDILPFPRQAGSWYHLTKVHDSHNVMFACRIWGLRSTDIMQGVVFGTRIDEMGDDSRLATRLDFDECFGTVINRYCCQAVIGHPLTPFGKGHQTRGFLPLRDSMQCLTLAIESPPKKGEYRVFNQFERTFDVTELAFKVKEAGRRGGIDVEIRNLENPRKEAEKHYYNPDHQHLSDLGYKPSIEIEDELVIMMADLAKHEERIEARKGVLIPEIHWNGQHEKVGYINHREQNT